jgi:hypothetical protein
MKSALIITSATALNGHESGASLRTETLRDFLSKLNFSVQIVGVTDFHKNIAGSFDLIVLTPFTTARAYRKAKLHSKLLWFDACDSWKMTRLTRIRNGEFTQVFALVRDYYYLRKIHSVDLTTFISEKDGIFHSRFVDVCKANSFIFPNNLATAGAFESKRSRIVFIGDGKYGPNKAALKFIHEILNYLPANYSIEIIGKDFESNNPRIINHGYVSPDNLYGKLDIHLAPIFAGAGINNKVVRPLALGLPVVTTTFGMNGIKPSGNLRIAHTPKEFASNILDLINKESAFPPLVNPYISDQTKELSLFLRNKFYE